MKPVLLAFHGFTLNGELMRQRLEPFIQEWEPELDLVAPDAPHPCSPQTVEAMRQLMRGMETPAPHLCWWNASSDASVYEGLDRTLLVVREEMERRAPIGVLGFSQGAMLAAVIAALSARSEVPAIRFAVLIAGATPRAKALQPLFERPIDVPSLHVYGDRDLFAGANAARLAEHFDPSSRSVHIWPGSHVIPTRGAAAQEISTFVRRHVDAARQMEP
jgi:predicted esterase